MSARWLGLIAVTLAACSTNGGSSAGGSDGWPVDGTTDATNVPVDAAADAANEPIDATADAASVPVDATTDTANVPIDATTDATNETGSAFDAGV